MNFGYQQCSFLWPNGTTAELFERTRATARKVEAAGFVSYWLMDHLLQVPLLGAADEPLLEAWTTLAAVAAVTNRIRLGTLVSAVGFRNPALLAKMAATLDVISGGRLILGLGAGYFEPEYTQYGYDYVPEPWRRIRQMEEAIRAVKALWTEPRATFEGRTVQVRNAILEPKPLQRPHPPILVGGGGERLTLRVAARHANAVNWFGGPDEIRHKRAVLARHCAAEGREVAGIEITNWHAILIGRLEKDVTRKRIKYHLGDRTLLSGSVAGVIDQLAALQEAGVQQVILHVAGNDPETLDLLGTEVIPALR